MTRDLKVVIIGEGGSGKTTLCKRILGISFDPIYEATLGAEVHTYEVSDVRWYMWDIAGQSKYGGLRDGYYIGADLCIIVTDNRKISRVANFWCNDFQRICPGVPVLLVRNKSEIISTDNNPNAHYVSAKTGDGIPALLKKMGEMFNYSISEETINTNLTVPASIPTPIVEEVQSPTELISYSRSEKHSFSELVVYCARISNPTNQELNTNNDRLINYLVTHKHWSPFEMVSICISINTTRDISRQILRHRSFSYQEFSQRYAEAPPEPHFRECRLQDTKNRQSSNPTSNEELISTWVDLQKEASQVCLNNYKTALSMGIAKEQARALLPEGMTSTNLYMSGTLRSWIHYIELRSGPETQKEHREIAISCAKSITEIFPQIMNFVSE